MAKKISISQARKQYAEGATIGILANKLRYGNMYFAPAKVQIDKDGSNFDSLVSSYYYYNSDPEMQRGKTPAFYLVKKAPYVPSSQIGAEHNPGKKRIVGVALNPSGKFLGFIDGSGRIRKGRVRKVRVGNPATPEGYNRKWYMRGYQTGYSGRQGDYVSAWHSAKGKPGSSATSGKRIEAQESFYAGFHEGQGKRASR